MLTEEIIDNVTESNDYWETWLADTGASCHVTNNDKDMVRMTTNEGDKVMFGDKSKCNIEKSI